MSNPAPGSQARADLHCHSRHSDRPSEWFLRRIGAPESFVDPMDLYKAAKARGMKFVTISDHNCIAGALEIAHLPDVFISNEVTTYFPEDGCKVHMLVTGINEAQFEAIQDLRPNIYTLQRYLRAEGIIHSIAHPLFRVNDRLTTGHFEKLVLLFERFEAINGTRDKRACAMAQAILSNLTPGIIADLANKHGLDPAGDQPWVKAFTGGSDDHSGLYVGSAHTVTPPAATVEQYLDHLRNRRHYAGGEHGTSVMLGHCFYHIAYAFYRDRFLKNGGNTLMGDLFKKLLTPGTPGTPAPGSESSAATGIGGRVRNRIRAFVAERKMKKLSPVERLLVGEFRKLYEHSGGRGGVLDDRATFDTACRISHTLGYAFGREFEKHLRGGNLIQSLQTLAALGPVAMSIAPYLASFKTQHKDAGFLERMARHFRVDDCRQPEGFTKGRKAWLTDTFADTNGVAVTIKTLAAIAKQQGDPLSVITCLPPEPPEMVAGANERGDAADGIDLVNFEPVGLFNVPEYEQQALAFPPFLRMIEHVEAANYNELIISTPGPVGLVGLAAAKLLGLPTVGVYHTDFPAYVRHLTDDAALEALTARYMAWFYGQMDAIFVPSPSYRQMLIRQGFDAGKLMLLPRGVDLRRFNPNKADRQTWRRWGLDPTTPKLIYVGRVSREKNLHLLADAWKRMNAEAESSLPGTAADLVIVGDGPYLAELRELFGGDKRVCFTGYLGGEELAAAYASADVFVFPSTTDTFGNVVLEAQASGLPAIVSDQGGPADLVRRQGSGLIVNVADPEALPAAMGRLIGDRALHRELSQRAVANAARSSWPRVLDQLMRTRPPRRELAEKPMPPRGMVDHTMASFEHA